MTKENPIIYWSFDNMRVLLRAGDYFPITNVQDAFGEETDMRDEAAFIIAGPDSRGKWWNIQTSLIPETRIQ